MPRKSLSEITGDPGEAQVVPARGDGPPPAAAPPPVAETSVDDALLARWRWSLGATARKAAAARERATAAQAAWERLCADAADAGIPGRLIVAAAADAGVDVPGGE